MSFFRPITLYRILWVFFWPLCTVFMWHRKNNGKEDFTRIGERYGKSLRHRPNGNLVWFHCASVGESISILPIIKELIGEDLHVLVTTGTVTSSKIMADRLPEKAIHQYVPIDYYPYVKRFMNHWKPDVSIFVESDLWPNLIALAPNKIVVNGRISTRSFKRYKKFSWFYKTLMQAFRLCLVQQAKDVERFKALGAQHAHVAGNLKFDAEPLAHDGKMFKRTQKHIQRRKIIIFASTHSGEEEKAAAIHIYLKEKIPNLLTIIIPRHPHRGTEIVNTLENLPLIVHRRGMGESPVSGGEQHTDIYIADTLGELGLWYRLAHVVVVGGSFVRHGGHNPIEPLKLEKVTMTGPYMENFTDMLPLLTTKGLLFIAKNLEDLVNLAHLYLTDRKRRLQQEQKISLEMKHLTGAKDVALTEIRKALHAPRS